MIELIMMVTIANLFLTIYTWHFGKKFSEPDIIARDATGVTPYDLRKTIRAPFAKPSGKRIPKVNDDARAAAKENERL